jgi:hypothetical protein
MSANGGPAFPLPRMVYENHIDPPQVIRESAGMTLLDYFAGQALASMTVAPDYSKGPCNAAMAERAYVIAELMLTEKAKREAKQ